MTISITHNTAIVDPHDCDHMFLADVILSQKDVDYKSREKLILMKIDDFLSMAEHTIGCKEKSDRIQGMILDGLQFNAVPRLFFYKQEDGTQRVEGHEGRHRAFALRALGYQSMPVALKCDIRWSEQDNENNMDYVREWPEKLFSQDSVRVSIDFPVARQDCNASYKTAVSPLNVEEPVTRPARRVSP